MPRAEPVLHGPGCHERKASAQQGQSGAGKKAQVCLRSPAELKAEQDQLGAGSAALPAEEWGAGDRHPSASALLVAPGFPSDTLRDTALCSSRPSPAGPRVCLSGPHPCRLHQGSWLPSHVSRTNLSLTSSCQFRFVGHLKQDFWAPLRCTNDIMYLSSGSATFNFLCCLWNCHCVSHANKWPQVSNCPVPVLPPAPSRVSLVSLLQTAGKVPHFILFPSSPLSLLQ